MALESPAFGAMLTLPPSGRLHVRGRLLGLASCRVSVNGEEVPVAADGRFETRVRARPGLQTLQLEAASPEGPAFRLARAFLVARRYSNQDPVVTLRLGWSLISRLAALAADRLASWDAVALLPHPTFSGLSAGLVPVEADVTRIRLGRLELSVGPVAGRPHSVRVSLESATPTLLEGTWRALGLGSGFRVTVDRARVETVWTFRIQDRRVQVQAERARVRMGRVRTDLSWLPDSFAPALRPRLVSTLRRAAARDLPRLAEKALQRLAKGEDPALAVPLREFAATFRLVDLAVDEQGLAARLQVQGPGRAEVGRDVPGTPVLSPLPASGFPSVHLPGPPGGSARRPRALHAGSRGARAARGRGRGQSANRSAPPTAIVLDRLALDGFLRQVWEAGLLRGRWDFALLGPGETFTAPLLPPSLAWIGSWLNGLLPESFRFQRGRLKVRLPGIRGSLVWEAAAPPVTVGLSGAAPSSHRSATGASATGISLAGTAAQAARAAAQGLHITFWALRFGLFLTSAWGDLALQGEALLRTRLSARQAGRRVLLELRATGGRLQILRVQPLVLGSQALNGLLARLSGPRGSLPLLSLLPPLWQVTLPDLPAEIPLPGLRGRLKLHGWRIAPAPSSLVVGISASPVR